MLREALEFAMLAHDVGQGRQVAPTGLRKVTEPQAQGLNMPDADVFLPTMRTADALVDALLSHGVDTIYALPGAQSDPLFDAFWARRDRLRLIHPRHEQAAAYMALGAALATGRPQACSVVPGPGFLNSSAALLTAMSMHAPVVALVGQIPLADIDRGLGHLHELKDQTGLASHFCKYTARVRQPWDAYRLVAEAISHATSGRPGPAMLDLPMDVMAKRGPVSPEGPKLLMPAPVADPAAIEHAARLLADSRKPLIVVGGGAQDAGREVQALAEYLEAPVAGYRRGTGVIRSDHRLNVRLPVSHRLWADADVILGIGTRLHMQQSMWGAPDDLPIIRIDIDPNEPDRFRKASVALVGDAAPTCRALLDALRKQGIVRDSREEELAANRAWLDDKLACLEPQMSFLQAIRRALPADGIFVDEVTQVGFVGRLGFPVYGPRTYLSPGYQDNLGWGIGTALGVQAACPGRAVLAIAGDGGFLYQIGELATAVLHDLPVVFIVFDNAMFGNVKRIQQERYDNHIIGAELKSPDFAALARSFGALGVNANTPEELEHAVRSGFQARQPTVVHVRCGEMPSPWPLILMPRVR